MDTIIQQFQEKITKDIKKEIENIFLEGIMIHYHFDGHRFVIV